MKLKHISLAVAVFGGWIGTAIAGTATGSITNTITVAPAATVISCSFEAIDLNPLITYVAGGTEVNYFGSLLLQCTSSPPGPVNMPASIGFGPGQNMLLPFRRATGAGNYINYQLKSTISPMPILDLAVGGFFGGSELQVTVSSGQASVPYTLTLPGGQTVPTGGYADSVVVVATF